ncbi:MAG TPA: hypothetical protein VNO31_10780 [Umezawaea sp.]|nr:hypothetical protein [Umezawaea sp.]
MFFTNTKDLFGPSEMRAAGVVNFNRQGGITRWVDYWDGRHFGTADLDASRLPADRFPPDFKESTVGETAALAVRAASNGLNAALRDGNGTAAAGLFAGDAVFEDVSAHVQVIGPRSIGAYLTATAGTLPYSGPGVAVRHVVGGSGSSAAPWPAGPAGRPPPPARGPPSTRSSHASPHRPGQRGGRSCSTTGVSPSNRRRTRGSRR